jgi:hypothetical protein
MLDRLFPDIDENKNKGCKTYNDPDVKYKIVPMNPIFKKSVTVFNTNGRVDSHPYNKQTEAD